MPGWEDVLAIGRRFPEVEESTWFGTPSLKVHGKSMCRLRTAGPTCTSASRPSTPSSSPS